MLKKLLLTLMALVLLLTLAVAANTWRQGSQQPQVAAPPAVTVDRQAAAQRLARAVHLPTISSLEDAGLNRDQFLALHALLEQQFPRVHASLKRETAGSDGLSLLYTWPGSQPDADPILLLAHQDVVPIAPGTEGDWEQEPFAGTIADGYIWGRGAWDDKGNLLAQLEAIELLLASDWQPRRTIHLAYGADEEVGGLRGATHMAALLQERGIRPALVLDEGLLVLDGIMPGLKQPAALIGVAEKGYASVRLTVSTQPGHSSMPPPRGSGAIAMLSAALDQLEQQQMPAHLGGGVAGQMFDTLAPHMGGFSRVALSNLWLFGPLVKKQLEGGGSTNAMLRTTTALTIVEAGNKDNVLPGRAQATINFRLLPGDTIEDVLQHVNSVVGKVVPSDQFAVEVLPGAREASKVAPTEGWPYDTLARTVRELFPDAVVAPGLMVAATDSARYDPVSDHIFKFSPIRAGPNDLGRFHGTNERLSVDGYADAIRFYHRLLQQLAGSAESD